jgi:tetratricopeptide (TPR) repeat protein
MDRGHKKALRLLLEQHPIVASWPTSAVVSFFEAIGLHQYASTMDKMSVNWRQLSKATLDSLAAVFCISSFGHRSSIIQALEYCAKHSPALQPTMHSGALVSQFAVEDELSARSMMRRRQAWKKYESFRDRAAMPPIKNYTKVVMNKSDIDKLLASPDARREAWIEYMTQPAAVAAPSRVKSPPREGLSDKERAAIERKFSNILQQHGVASIMLRHNFVPLEMGGASTALPPSPRTRMTAALLCADNTSAEGDASASLMSWIEYVTLARLIFGTASLQVVRALFHIGTLRLQLRHYPLALEKFAEAASIAHGLHSDARASGDDAAFKEISSQLALVLEGLGVVCTKLKRWDDAVTHLDDALALSRDQPSTTALVARAELHCARMQYEDGLKLLDHALKARGDVADEHSARIFTAQAKIKMRQLQLLQEYLLELEPALQAASAVKLELLEKAVKAAREGLPHDGSAVGQLQSDVDEMTRSKQKIEVQCRMVVDGANMLLQRALKCASEGEQNEKIQQRLVELQELQGKYPWLRAS